MRRLHSYRGMRISITLTVLGMWFLFFHEVLKSFCQLYPVIAYSGYILLFSALFIELMNGALLLLEDKYRSWVMAILCVGVLCCLYGLIKGNSLQFLSRDLWPYSYFSCFLIAARNDAWRTVDRMICLQFIVGLIVFLYISATIDLASPTRQLIMKNTSQWGGVRIYWAWGLLYGWQYMFLRFGKDQPLYQKIVTVLGVTSYIIFGVIMLKRQVIFELGMLCFAKFVYMKVVEKTSIARWIITIVVIGIATYSSLTYYQSKYNVDYAKNLSERTLEHGSVFDTALENTRMADQPRDVYRQASVFEVIHGQGLGSVVKNRGPAKVTNTLENAAATMFMKGGVISLIVWYFGFFFIIKDTILLKKRDRLLYGLLSTIFIISLPMVPFFTDYLWTGYKMFWLGRCASRLS